MANKTNAVLQVTDLVKTYGEHTVLDGINLTVKEGEALALVGRNGAGKSTLLRCLVGAERPTSGTVEFIGRTMKETNVEVRRHLATVLDDLDFFPDLSVVEHLDLLARAHAVEDPEGVVDALLAELDLVPQSGQLPGTLSSGQRRRLALATALVRPCKLIILDEPEQRLDVEGIEWLGERLRKEAENGKAIVMACHDPVLIKAVGAKVVRIGSRESKAAL